MVADFLASKAIATLKKLSAETPCRSMMLIYETDEGEFVSAFGGDIDVLGFYEQIERIEEHLAQNVNTIEVPLTVLREEDE